MSLPLYKSILSRVSVRWTVPLLLFVPLVLVSAALITVGAIRGRAAARTLAMDSFANTHNEISRRLDDMVSMPGQANQFNVRLLREGKLDLRDLTTWQTLLSEEARIFGSLSCISWDGADGRQAWMARYPGGKDYWFAVNNDPTTTEVREYRCGPEGLVATTQPRSYQIDPRQFTPYRTGAATTQPGWTKPFDWVNEDGSKLTFALANVQSYRDGSGKLLGVLTAQFTLYDISRYLSQLSLGAHGRAFVIDHEGYLMADSRSLSAMDTQRHRVLADEAGEPVVAAGLRGLRNAVGGWTHLDTPRREIVQLNGKPYLVMASPFKHSTGLRWSIVTLAPQSDFTGDVERAGREAVKIALGIALVTLVGGVGLSVAALRPLLKLVAHVHRVGDGDFDTRLTLPYSPEFVQLSDAINRMTIDLGEHTRLRHSLALADEVQRNLLPSHLPEVPGLDVAATARYCDQTGGDYYDFPVINGVAEGSLLVAVGDVMGHGIPAAMLMASARGILRSRCDVTGCLGELLGHLNRHLLGDGNSSSGRFMTMLLMMVDRPQGTLRWASAGHDMPIVYDPADDRFVELDQGGLPLGVMADSTYEEGHFAPVRAGQVLLVGTDGLWETRNAEGEDFGKRRVREIIRRCGRRSAQEIVAALDEAMTEFRGEASIEDDITVVVVRVV